MDNLPMAVAIGLACLLAWDIGRRWLAGVADKQLDEMKRAINAREIKVDDELKQLKNRLVETRNAQGVSKARHLTGLGGSR